MTSKLILSVKGFVLLAWLSLFSATSYAQDLATTVTVDFNGANFPNLEEVILNPYNNSGFSFLYSGSNLYGDGDDGQDSSDAIYGAPPNTGESLRIDYSGSNFRFESFYFINTVSAINLRVEGFDG